MYIIDEANHREKYRLIVPATLDYHFPLIKYMFWSKNYWVEILENKEGVTDAGLAHANNDMCYPFIELLGQTIQELRSGKFPIEKTRLLIPTAGDACRGACYIGLFKKGLQRAGLSDCKVVTLNVRHIAEDINMEIGPSMGVRGLFGLYYGDILMLLANQVRPYEVNKGQTDALWQKWIDKLADDIKRNRHLTIGAMFRNFNKICEDFKSIEVNKVEKQRIGIVGEFYVKYCSLGNWDVVKFLESRNCETHTNGLSWYAIYYVDTHMPDKFGLERMAFKIAKSFLLWVQRKMIASLEAHGFYTLPDLEVLKEESKDYVSQNLTIGDGWLLGTEVVAYANRGSRKALCITPFGCMANVCAGRGLYPHLQRRFPEAHIVSVEVDASGAESNYYNRVEMLIHSRHQNKK